MRPERALVLVLALALALAVAGPAGAKDKAPARPKELSADGRANVMLAQSYLDAGRVDDAEKRAKAALLTDGDVALAHATMALVHVAKSREDAARKEFDRARKLAPGDGAILNAYGSFLCAHGDRAGADAAFQLALADQRYATPVKPLVNAGRCAAIGGDWGAADGYLRRAVAIAPRERVVLLLLAETQLKLGRALEARAFVERADALGPEPNTLALAARTEDAAGDAEASARYRKRLREEFPKYVPKAEGAGKQ
jgi:type IV pilus assembly protein PilF